MNSTSDVLAASTGSHFHTLDYTVFGSLLLLSILIGVYFGFFDGSEKTTDEYLLGGRRMKAIPVAISLIASQLSAFTIISIPAEIYSFGSHIMIMDIPGVIICTLLINYGVLPVFYANDISNCYAYLELRFGKTIRSIITAFFLFAMLTFLPITSFLPAIAFSQVTGLNIHMINAVVIIICASYTMLGGVKAVVWTDVAQAFVMVLSVVTVLVFAVNRVGGWSVVLERAIEGQRLTVPPMALDLTTRQTFWNLGICLSLNWVAYIGFNQSCVQRMSALPSLKEAQKTLFIVCVGLLFIKNVTGMIGLAMYVFYRDCDPVASGTLSQSDKLIPYFVNDIIGHLPGIPGIFISCVFSASLSTVSAIFNTISGILYTDYICRLPKFVHSERKASVIMRLIIVVIGAYCIALGFLVEKSTSLFQVQFTLSGLTSGVVFGVFTLALFYPKASEVATVWGSIAGTLIMGWFITYAQIYNKVHGTSYRPLPSSTNGCAAANITALFKTNQSDSSTTEQLSPNVGTSIFQTSFQWYPLFGTMIVWIVAIVLSHTIAPRRKPSESRLLSPLIRWAFNNDDGHMEMSEVRVKAVRDLHNNADEKVYAVR